MSLGELKFEQKAYADAEKFLRHALPTFEKRNPDSWKRYYVQSILGATLSASGNHAEAESLLAAGYQGILDRQDSIPAESRPVLQQVHEWLAKSR